jgi:hypothetical protein
MKTSSNAQKEETMVKSATVKYLNLIGMIKNIYQHPAISTGTVVDVLIRIIEQKDLKDLIRKLEKGYSEKYQIK